MLFMKKLATYELKLAFNMLARIDSFYGIPAISRTGYGLISHSILLTAFVRVLSKKRFLVPALFISNIALFMVSKYRIPSKGARIFCFAPTLNNVKSINRVTHLLPDSVIHKASMGEKLSLVSKFRMACKLSVSISVAKIISRRVKDPYAIVQCLIAMNFFMLLRENVKLNQDDILLVSNDHSPLPLALTFYYKRNYCKTCYVQHAPVSEYFPSLIFDLSILHDIHSAQIYENKPNKNLPRRGSVVIHPPFSDEFQGIRNLTYVNKVIGICLGLTVNLPELKRLIFWLGIQPEINRVIVRLHPRSNGIDKEYWLMDKVIIDKSNSFREFCSEIDCNIVGNSGVIIESLHFGCKTLYLSDLDFIEFDYYGFLEQGLIPEYQAENLNDGRYFKNFYNDSWLDRYKKYDHTIGRSMLSIEKKVGNSLKKNLVDC